MEIITSYKDLCEEIELLEFLLNDLQRQLKATHKIINTGKAPSSIPCFVPLNKSLAQYDNIMERAHRLQEEIEHKKEFQQEITTRLARLEGMEYIVFRGRYIEGKSLQQIADEQGYSYSVIARASARIKPHTAIAIAK